ncbi:MAG: DUF4338 domain-containing protein [Desulfobacteraceae bacterium]
MCVSVTRLSSFYGRAKRHVNIKPNSYGGQWDRKRYHGGCYRAANWIELGETSGRGRMDRAGKRHGAEVKKLLVYPLVKNVQRRSVCRSPEPRPRP